MKDKIIQQFKDQFGRPPAVIARSPGRINMMGRHVDHQGGDVNMLAVNRYLYAAAAPREDSNFKFTNIDPENYADFELDLREAPLWEDGDWHDFVDSPEVIKFRKSLPLWCLYLAGVIFRLNKEFGDSLPGLNICCGGDLPAAAGLSSSSALSLSMVLASCELLGRSFEHAHLIQLSSESEKVIGLKGGTGDPAAMLASQPDRVVQLGCIPFSLKGIHPFPAGHRIVLANSHDRAAKGDNARNGYNWRVSVYRISKLILHRLHPEWRDFRPHLRDFVDGPNALGPAAAYRLMLELPITIDRENLLQSFAEDAAELEDIFSSHMIPDGGYPLRDILLYGLAEMARSCKLGELLDSGDLETLGSWIRFSHDGDRVSRMTETRVPWHPTPLDDSELNRLIRCAEENDPNAALENQSGAYTCSTENVDELVDLCDSTDGCLGSQILGAGMGGCIMALVKEEAQEPITQKLLTDYYEPRQLPGDVWSVVPGEGASVERIL